MTGWPFDHVNESVTWIKYSSCLNLNCDTSYFSIKSLIPAGRALWCPAGVYRHPGQVGFPGDVQQQGSQPHCCDWLSAWPCRQSPAKLPEPPLSQSRCCRCSVGRRLPLTWRAYGSRCCRTPGWSGELGTPDLGKPGARHTAARWAAACSGCPVCLRCVQGKGSPQDLPPPLPLHLSLLHPHCLLSPWAAFRPSRRLLTTSSTSLPPSRLAQPPPVYPSCRLSVCLSEGE